MSQVVIENPIINSPFDEPPRHFRFSDEGITNEIVEGQRRISSYFVPIARPKKKKGAAQPVLFDTEWTQDRIEENKLDSLPVVDQPGGNFVGTVERGKLTSGLILAVTEKLEGNTTAETE